MNRKHLEKSLAGSNEILFTTEATREEVEGSEVFTW